MSNPAYLALPLDMRGAYQTLRNLAGLRNNNGSIRIGGSERLTFEELVDYLAMVPLSAKRTTGRRRAGAIMTWRRAEGVLIGRGT